MDGRFHRNAPNYDDTNTLGSSFKHVCTEDCFSGSTVSPLDSVSGIPLLIIEQLISWKWCIVTFEPIIIFVERRWARTRLVLANFCRHVLFSLNSTMLINLRTVSHVGTQFTSNAAQTHSRNSDYDEDYRQYSAGIEYVNHTNRA